MHRSCAKFRPDCLQAALAPGYELHKEGAAVYTVPQGTEIEIFRKVAPAPAAPQPFHVQTFHMRHATFHMLSPVCSIGSAGR